jgi:phenylpropionate dioxygenase-like ring-hydroxylating dioxygenase large terminal subunit
LTSAEIAMLSSFPMDIATTNDNRSVAELVAAQKPGWALDQRFYTDPDIYQLELDRIVARNWVFAGHQSELPDEGDFKVLKVANESAIIVRGRDGTLSAFANVCRHRGSLVCLDDEGNTRKFECPYHGWVYDTDGNLLAARNMPADFDKSEHRLHAVSIELLHGFIFICFCDSPPSLAGAIRDLAEPMAMFDTDNLKVAATKVYPIAANWKLAIENYQECYHCATAHPDYAKMHTLMLDDSKRERVQGHMLENIEKCGLRVIDIDFIDTEARPGEQGYGYSRTALFDGYQTGSKDGAPVAPLLGKLQGYDGGASDLEVGPFSFFLMYSDHVVGYVFTPVDHLHCQCQIYWMVRGDAEEGKDYDRDALMWLWDITTLADETIIVNNWTGVQSRYYQPGPFSGMESAERCFIEWVLQQLQD